jgi:hypothetical protein
MTYSEFTIDDLRRTFHLTVRDRPLFPQLGRIAPSDWLQQALRKGKDLAVLSEKARSEFIAAPVLVTCRELLEEKIHVFSGVRLDAAPELGLKGECDFILARSESSFVLQAPLMVIVEANKNDMEEGLVQCAAEMLGARVFNEKDGKPLPFIYGCVTTGEIWQFLKLENGDLVVHPKRLKLEEIDSILWFIVECVKDVYRHVPADAAA